MTQQWYSVNTAQSVSATMAVGSFVALCTVGAPVGAALGLAAAGAGVSATTRDFVGDYFRGDAFARAVQEDTWEQLGFVQVESELRRAVRSAVEVDGELEGADPMESRG